MPFLYRQVENFVKTGGESHEKVLDELKLTKKDIQNIERKTRDQGDSWRLHRKGFLTSSKIKDIVQGKVQLKKHS